MPVYAVDRDENGNILGRIKIQALGLEGFTDEHWNHCPVWLSQVWSQLRTYLEKSTL